MPRSLCAPRGAEGRDVHRVGSRGVDHDATDRARVAEAHLGPGASAVGRLVDPVPQYCDRSCSSHPCRPTLAPSRRARRRGRRRSRCRGRSRPTARSRRVRRLPNTAARRADVKRLGSRFAAARHRDRGDAPRVRRRAERAVVEILDVLRERVTGRPRRVAPSGVARRRAWRRCAARGDTRTRAASSSRFIRP